MERLFRFAFPEIGGEIHVGHVGPRSRHVLVDRQPGPIGPAGGRIGHVGLLGRLEMGPVEVGEVAGDVGGESRAHQLLGGRGGPLARQDRLAAAGERRPGPAGARLVGARRGFLANRSGHGTMRYPNRPWEARIKLPRPLLRRGGVARTPSKQPGRNYCDFLAGCLWWASEPSRTIYYVCRREILRLAPA